MSSANLIDTGLYVASEKSLRVIPKYYRYDQTKTGIIFTHGHGGDALQARDGINAPGLNAIMEAIGENGNPILSCDMAGNSWGSATAISRMSSAYNLLTGAMNAKSGKVILIGFSMGHTAAMNWTAQNLTKVAAVVGLLPVCDQNDINSQSAYTSSITAAYGTAYNESTMGATYNPLTMASAGKYTGLPWRGYSISDDTIATYSKVQAMTTALGSAASMVTLPGTGGHGTATLSKVDPADVLSFIRANQT